MKCFDSFGNKPLPVSCIPVPAYLFLPFPPTCSYYYYYVTVLYYTTFYIYTTPSSNHQPSVCRGVIQSYVYVEIDGMSLPQCMYELSSRDRKSVV